MGRVAMLAVRAGLLAGPTVLAFFSGGYFDGPRLWAAMGAWALLAVAALAAERDAFRLRTGAGLALGGLAVLTAWTWLSAGWAPRRGPAGQALEVALLYLAALATGVVAWRSRRAARWVEPALGAGTLVVVGYGLAGRLVPAVVDVTASLRAGGRLEQPLTYWNAMGALAAIGLVLCARVAGDPTRPRGLRAGAAAAAAPLGLGLYLSFSRGALACALAGLGVLVLLAPTRPQLRAAVGAAVAGLASSVAAAPFDAVRALEGTARDEQGAVVLALLCVVAALAAAAQAHAVHREAREAPSTSAPPGASGSGPGTAPLLSGRRWAAAAVAVAAVAAAPFVVAALAEGEEGDGAGTFGARSGRLSDVGSHRASYWRVAGEVWWDHPLHGAGAGAFGTEWLARRPIDERVRDAHSLYAEVPAELGLVGLAALAALLAGIALAARRCLALDRALAAGPAAAALTWALHAGLDWDWELPALTAVAAVLAGVLLCRAQAAPAHGAQQLGQEGALQAGAEGDRDQAEEGELAQRLRLRAG